MMTHHPVPDLPDFPDLSDTPDLSRVPGLSEVPDLSASPAADPAGGPERLAGTGQDPLAGTPFARVQLPPNVFGFGFGELRHVLARVDSPAARRSAAVLGFEEDQPSPALADGVRDVMAAGVSSLLARGLLAVDAAGDTHTAGAAALLESLFATAARWTVFSYRVGDRADLLVMIEGVGQVGLLQARQYGTWFVGITPHANGFGDPAGIAVTAMTAMTDLYGGGTFAVKVRSLERPHGVRFVSSDPAVADDLQKPSEGTWVVTGVPDGNDVLMRGSVATVIRWVLADLEGAT